MLNKRIIIRQSRPTTTRYRTIILLINNQGLTPITPDKQFQIVFEAIKQLLSEEDKPKKKIGFTVKEKQKAYARKG
jgi:hypothetical protein